jgi:hypothetical protein
LFLFVLFVVVSISAIEQLGAQVTSPNSEQNSEQKSLQARVDGQTYPLNLPRTCIVSLLRDEIENAELKTILAYYLAKSAAANSEINNLDFEEGATGFRRCLNSNYSSPQNTKNEPHRVIIFSHGSAHCQDGRPCLTIAVNGKDLKFPWSIFEKTIAHSRAEQIQIAVCHSQSIRKEYESRGKSDPRVSWIEATATSAATSTRSTNSVTSASISSTAAETAATESLDVLSIRQALETIFPN